MFLYTVADRYMLFNPNSSGKVHRLWFLKMLTWPIEDQVESEVYILHMACEPCFAICILYCDVHLLMFDWFTCGTRVFDPEPCDHWPRFLYPWPNFCVITTCRRVSKLLLPRVPFQVDSEPYYLLDMFRMENMSCMMACLL